MTEEKAGVVCLEEAEAYLQSRKGQDLIRVVHDFKEKFGVNDHDTAEIFRLLGWR